MLWSARFAAMPRLKVFRTAIGFHDAYVAAPSRKAALKAWGADVDLFARGAAEQITDEALMEEPLAHPNQVIRRSRGTVAQHLAASTHERPGGNRRKQPDDRDAATARPRPTRDRLLAAEKALKDRCLALDAEVGRLEAERARLKQDIDRRRDEAKPAIAALQATVKEARAAFDQAMSAWRAD